MSSTSGGVSARDLSHISSNLARSALHTVQAEASEQARSTLGEGEDSVTELVVGRLVPPLGEGAAPPIYTVLHIRIIPVRLGARRSGLKL